MRDGRISAKIIRKILATHMYVHLPDDKDHLAALAEHKNLTQVRYYRGHDMLVKSDLGQRALNKLLP